MDHTNDVARALPLHTSVSAVIALALVFATYCISFTGHIVSGDNIIQFQQTVQLVDRHRLTFTTDQVATILRDNDWGLNTRFGLNRDGKTFSQVHGIGQAIMTLPLFVPTRLVKHALGFLRPTDMTLWCMNWLLFAVISVALVMWTCVCAGLSPLWTALLSFGAAFASPIWMFSDIPYNVVGENIVLLAAIGLCVTLEWTTLVSVRARPFVATTIAALVVFAVVVRPFAVTAAPAFVAWLAGIEGISFRRPFRSAQALLAFTVTLSIGAVIIAGYNTLYFGSPLASPYHQLGRVINFEKSWWTGTTGSFLSPLKSPLYFFPLIISLPVTLTFLTRARDRVAAFAALFLIPQVYLIPKYSFWSGGPDLFDRLWLRVLPVVFLAVVAVVRRMAPGTTWYRGALICVAVLVGFGYRAQILTVLTDERAVYADVAHQLAGRNDDSEPELEYRESIVGLLGGATVVSHAQVAALTMPRPFLLVRNNARPWQRLPFVIAGSAAAAAAFAIFGFLSRSEPWPSRRSSSISAAAGGLGSAYR